MCENMRVSERKWRADNDTDSSRLEWNCFSAFFSLQSLEFLLFLPTRRLTSPSSPATTLTAQVLLVDVFQPLIMIHASHQPPPDGQTRRGYRSTGSVLFFSLLT